MQTRAANKYSFGQFAGVCGILLTLSAAMVWIAFNRRAQILAILDHGVLAQATSGYQYHGKSSGTRYQFEVNGVEYSGSTGSLYPPGIHLPVRYEPENPKNNAEDGSLSRTNADQVAWGSLAVGPIYCGLAGVIFLVGRRKRV